MSRLRGELGEGESQFVKLPSSNWVARHHERPAAMMMLAQPSAISRFVDHANTAAAMMKYAP
jgi:hypothetical protein